MSSDRWTVRLDEDRFVSIEEGDLWNCTITYTEDAEKYLKISKEEFLNERIEHIKKDFPEHDVLRVLRHDNDAYEIGVSGALTLWYVSLGKRGAYEIVQIEKNPKKIH